MPLAVPAQIILYVPQTTPDQHQDVSAVPAAGLAELPNPLILLFSYFRRAQDALPLQVLLR